MSCGITWQKVTLSKNACNTAESVPGMKYMFHFLSLTWNTQCVINKCIWLLTYHKHWHCNENTFFAHLFPNVSIYKITCDKLRLIKHQKLKWTSLIIKLYWFIYQPYFYSDHSLHTRDKFTACDDMLAEFTDFLEFIINKAHRYEPSSLKQKHLGNTIIACTQLPNSYTVNNKDKRMQRVWVSKTYIFHLGHMSEMHKSRLSGCPGD